MKKLLQLSLILCALFLGAKVSAQTFAISNYTTTIYEPTNIYGIESHVTIDNTTSNPVDVIIERTIVNLFPGHTESFCFGLSCYPSGTSSTWSGSNPAVITMGAGKGEDFKASVDPNANSGTTNLHYRIFDQNNSADSIGFDLNFVFGSVGIAENKEEFGVSKSLRNPADAFTLFSYNLKSDEISDKLVVFNMLGSMIKSIALNGQRGTVVMNTSELNNGIYLVSYMSGNKVRSTSKLVVRHN